MGECGHCSVGCGERRKGLRCRNAGAASLPHACRRRNGQYSNASTQCRPCHWPAHGMLGGSLRSYHGNQETFVILPFLSRVSRSSAERCIRRCRQRHTVGCFRREDKRRGSCILPASTTRACYACAGILPTEWCHMPLQRLGKKSSSTRVGVVGEGGVKSFNPWCTQRRG